MTGKKGKTGERTRIYEPSNLWGKFIIGDDCTVGKFVEIGDGVRIGDRCKVEAFTQIPPGVVIEDEVFVGPHACFTNDRVPRAVGEWKRLTTPVKRRASIGANATVLPGPHHTPSLGKMSQGWRAG